MISLDAAAEKETDGAPPLRTPSRSKPAVFASKLVATSIDMSPVMRSVPLPCLSNLRCGPLCMIQLRFELSPLPISLTLSASLLPPQLGRASRRERVCQYG